MKKPSSKIRDEILRLQEQLKHAETRDAERIGRIALKAGLGEIQIDEGTLSLAFAELAERFRGDAGKRGAGPIGKARGSVEGSPSQPTAALDAAATPARQIGEA